jgi:acetyl coenzyme A synthetase (ADP forming)-like protein
MTPQIADPRTEYDAVLADGGTVHIRAITPDDAAALEVFHSELSPESIYLRFFSFHPKLSPAELERFTRVDYHDRMALVGTLQGRIVGVARYDRSPANPGEAEVAFVVADSHHGRGLATLLLEHLAAYARTQGIRVFVAETLPGNQPMLEVFRRAGFAVESRFDEGLVDVRMEIAATDAFIDAVEERWRRATVRSVERLLRPRTIAVVGAGRRAGAIGHEIFRNLITGEFAGAVYPVHPSGEPVAGVKSYPTILAVPDDVDVAVVVVPAGRAEQVVEECAAKGVKGIVVISAGFAEMGRGGETQQADLVRLARGAGMRMVGPNCMGIINTAPDVSMNATFAPIPPKRGTVGFASQSGGLGIAVLAEAHRRDMGLSTFVSMGNKADVSSNDLIQYWEKDPDTNVILLYLESFGNPRRFARIARQASRTKPVVAVKAGRTHAGRRAATSHTAALASPDSAVDALFAQAGVIRVDTMEEFFDVAQVLSSQPVPSGRRVAIIGNAGGPGILAADACDAAGLEVPELSPPTQEALRAFLPAAAAVQNPVDMVASASAADYERTIRLALADPGIDALLVTFVPTLVTAPGEVASAVAAATTDAAKPVAATFVGMSVSPLGDTGSRVPSFSFPEPAVRALARACRYGEWRQKDPGAPPRFPDLDMAAARAVVRRALDAEPEGRWLAPHDAAELLRAYGVPVIAAEAASTPDEAVAAAGRIGFPVALKAGAADILHKTELGGVKLGLASGDEVRAAFSEMWTSLGESMGGVVVQAMAEPGAEVIVGVVHDRSFGPLVMFGTGGTTVELFGDRAFRILPLTRADASELVRGVRGSPLLFGFRGAAVADVDGVEDLLLRVARLADDFPELAEMDLNPVIASPKGVVAVDAKVRVVPANPDPDPTIRRLR